jgi:1,4-dihydroxy-2-naphthoyl-CoA hydrolase
MIRSPRVSEKKPIPNDEITGSDTVLVRQSRRVRFQDVDAAGTVFFPRILEYMCDAYLGLYDEAGIDLPGVLARRAWAAPYVHVEADFFGALRFGDAIDVELVVARLGQTSATFGYRIKKGEAIAGVGQTVHVFVDGQTFKPIEVPAELRELVVKLSARPNAPA